VVRFRLINNKICPANDDRRMTSIFEIYLIVWVGLCIVAGIFLGKVAPSLSRKLDGISINVNGALVVSVTIAICLFFMTYPILGMWGRIDV